MRYPLLSTMIAHGIKNIVDDPYSDMTRRIIRSMHDANPDGWAHRQAGHEHPFDECPSRDDWVSVASLGIVG